MEKTPIKNVKKVKKKIIFFMKKLHFDQGEDHQNKKILKKKTPYPIRHSSGRKSIYPFGG